MILIDTGPIVALFDKEDDDHASCHATLKTIISPLITTLPVLTEAFYLLSFSWHIQDDLWGFVTQGNLQIYNFDRTLLKTCREIMKQSHDLPMDFADASLVAVADMENINTVFTLDRDFKIYRTKKNRHFKLLPAI